MCEDFVHALMKGEMVDEITRLPNEKLYEKLEKSGEHLWVIKIHVEMKGLDDSYKDIAISRVASVIKHSVRLPKDLVIRVGERDFAIVMADVDDNIAKLVADRVKTNLRYLSLRIGDKTIDVVPEVNLEEIKG